MSDLLHRLRQIDLRLEVGSGPLQTAWEQGGGRFVARSERQTSRYYQAVRELFDCIKPAADETPILHEGGVYHGCWLESTGTINTELLSRFLPEIATGTAQAAADAAAHVVSWSGDNADDAAVLARFSLRDLLRTDVSPVLAARADALQAPVAPALRHVSAVSGVPLEDVLIAVVDLPNGVVRRLLADGQRPTSRDARAVRRAAARLLVGAGQAG